MQYPEIRKFLGLFLQQNSFEVPDGGMEIAENVVIQNDNEILKFPGFYTWWTPPAGFTIYQILKSSVGVYATGKLASMSQIYDVGSNVNDFNQTAVGVLIGGESFQVNVSYPSRLDMMNQIEYVTTETGPIRLDRYVADPNTQYVIKAGVPPGLDLEARVLTGATGPLPQDSQTSYRSVFARFDYKGNLLVGAPGDIFTVVLSADGAGVAYTSSGAGPYTVTVTSPAHGLSTGQSIIVSGATDADANGTVTITVTGVDTFTYSTAANPGAGTLTYTFSRQTEVELTIPDEINNANWNWLVRVYRTTSSASTTATPTPDFRLIYEQLLTAADLTRGFISFTDDIDPVAVGTELYTNPNSQEGELQANTRPPACRDICDFKNYMIYADCNQYQRVAIQLVDPSLLTGIFIRFASTFDPTEDFSPNTGVGNRTVAATSVAGAGTVTITYAAHGFLSGYTIYVSDVTGTVPVGTYTISNVFTNTFDIVPGGILTASALSFQGVTNGTNYIYYLDTSSSSLAQRIENTARYLVKAINRSSTWLYANYISTAEDLPGKIKIERQNIQDTFTEFTMKVSFLAGDSPFVPPVTDSNSTTVKSQDPSEPNVFYVSKYGEADAVPFLQSFPLGEKASPILRCFALQDAVIFIKTDGLYKLTGNTLSDFTTSPLDETLFGLSRSGAALINNRVMAITNQGVVEATASSAQIISRRIDRLIQDITGGYTNDPTFDTDITINHVSESAAVGYETARLWVFSMQTTSNNVPAQTYLYNVLNQTWTTCDQIFKQLVVSFNDRLFGLSESNTVYVQRKYSQKIDYSNEYQNVFAQSKVGDASIVYVSPGRGTYTGIKAGDVLVYAGLISRIQSVTTAPDGRRQCQMIADSNVPNTAEFAAVIYESYDSTIKFAPFHAGAVGREKQFSSVQLSLRQQMISRLDIDYSTGYYTEQEALDWRVTTIIDPDVPSGSGPQVTTYGWGEGPWGLFPWGSPAYYEWSFYQESSLIPVGTKPAVIVRTYVPLYAQRSTYIQPTFTHSQACESIAIQSVSWTVRGYGEKTTR